jgi:hypothetical protein
MTESGFGEFDRLTDLFVRARDVLGRVVRDESLPPGSSDFLADAVLPHVELVEEGFRVSLRANAADLGELRAFVRAAGVGHDEAGLADRLAALAQEATERLLDPPVIKHLSGAELAAIAHARLVFALLPQVPAEQVHWPRHWPHSGYGDVDPPRRPGELARRIEELEKHVWWTAAGRPAVADPAYRRTFGFFDTAAWLGSQVFGASA